MGIFKSVSGSSLSTVMDYVEKKAEKTIGIGCSGNKKEALEQFQETKEFYRKEGGRDCKHFVLSFSKEEMKKMDKEQILEFSEKVGNKCFKGFETFVALHTDTENYHCHLIVNSVNLDTGDKYRHSKKELEEYKDKINDLGKEFNFSLAKKENILEGEIRVDSKNKEHIIKKGLEGIKSSDIVNTYEVLNHILENNEVQNKEELWGLLNSEGVEMTWKETRKNVTFELDEKYSKSKKNKFRLSNLEKTFSDSRLTKKNLEKIFENNREIIKTREIEKEISRQRGIIRAEQKRQRDTGRGGRG